MELSVGKAATEALVHKWHTDFEKNLPDQHNDFLSLLGLK
jgi:hypothetical protein